MAVGPNNKLQHTTYMNDSLSYLNYHVMVQIMVLGPDVILFEPCVRWNQKKRSSKGKLSKVEKVMFCQQNNM